MSLECLVPGNSGFIEKMFCLLKNRITLPLNEKNTVQEEQ